MGQTENHAESRILDASELSVGLKYSFARQIAAEDVETFANLTGDHNPLHTDETYAGQTNYGRRIVHGAFQVGLDAETVSRQVDFGTQTTIRLARWLVRHVQSSGRMIVLGTTAATIKPVLNMAAYSLGKAAMEQTVRLLAPELASKGISINAVLPSFMPQGMNSAKTRHAILTETAKVPLGRLCSPDDIAGSIEYLLSEQGAFIAGQILPLTGGQQ